MLILTNIKKKFDFDYNISHRLFSINIPLADQLFTIQHALFAWFFGSFPLPQLYLGMPQIVFGLDTPYLLYIYYIYSELGRTSKKYSFWGKASRPAFITLDCV